MAKKLDSRVDELEKRHGGKPVYAVRYDDEELCRVVHSGELLTVEQLELKYPKCTLIQVNHVAMEPVEPVFGNL